MRNQSSKSPAGKRVRSGAIISASLLLMSMLPSSFSLTFFAFPPNASAEESKKVADGPHYFKLRVEVQDHIEELPPGLRVGSIFEESSLPQYSADERNYWYVVPTWLAGEYAYGPTRVTYTKDYVKDIENTVPGPEEAALPQGRLRGVFLDSKGQIWQKLYAGTVHTPSEHSFEGYHTLKFDDAVVGGIIQPGTYVESSTGSTYVISNSTKKILKVVRFERIRKFTLGPKGAVEVTYTDRDFDEEGKPLFTSTTRGTMVKISDFHDMRSDEPNNNEQPYKELAEDFRHFLIKQEKPELIPAGLAE